MIAAVLGVVGCGSKSTGTRAPAAVATVFPAGRFIPAQPTYVISSLTFRAAQGAFTQIIDMVGMTAGFEVSEASHGLSQVLGVDPMSADAVAAIGVDLDGSIAVFSEDVNPTFVVHLKSAEAMTGFLDGQRQRGLATQSVIAAGTEVFTAKIESDVHLSWAVEKEWLWVHFAFGGTDGVEWFEHSKQPSGADWVEGWKWARGLAQQASAVVGVVDLQRTFGQIARKASEAIACGKQFTAVKRVGFNFDIDAKHFAAQLAFDLGDDANRLRALLLPPPPGWAAASTNAPIAGEWNVDLPVATAWLEVCSGDDDFRVFAAQVGVRSIRGFMHSFDPDESVGVGAVSADLTSAQYFRGLLDQIPGRSMAESARTYGQYKGKHISVPFVGKGDYVLTDQIAIAAMGDGVLAKVGSGAAPAGPPAVMALDVRPPGLAPDVWQFLAQQANVPNPKRAVQRLMLWSELSLSARIATSVLVIAAHGNRR